MRSVGMIIIIFLLGLVQREEHSPLEQILLRFKEIYKRASNTCDLQEFSRGKALLQQGITSNNPNLYLFYYYLALADYRLAICSSPDEKKGEAFLREATKNIEVSMSLKGDFSDAHALLGAILGLRISFDSYRGPLLGPKSKKSIERAIHLDPQNPRAYLVQGISYYNTPSLFGGGVNKAIDALEHAIRLFEKERKEGTVEPSWGHDEAYGWLGLAYLKKRDRSRAEEVLKNGLALNPDNSWLRDLLGKVSSSNRR